MNRPRPGLPGRRVEPSRSHRRTRLSTALALIGLVFSPLDWIAKQNVSDAKLHALRGLAQELIDRIAGQDSKPAGAATETKSVK